MLAGSSGVGKNTLINELKKINTKVAMMPTLTTRQMRPGETQGNPFYFHSKEEFQEKIKKEELFEHELIHGNYYGSSKVIFNEYISKGNVLMKDIGVEGAVNLSSLLKDYTNTIKVFLTTKNKQVLVKRLKERGEKDIKKRLKRFPYEQAQKRKFDFIILNKTKEQTIQVLNEIIKNNNSVDNVIFTKRIEKLNKKRVKTLAEEYKLGLREDVVNVYLKDGKIILLNGEEKFVASLIAGVTLAKKVICKQTKPAKSELDQIKWHEYLNQLEK